MWIYILHFHTPLSHAQHYAGCTGNLLQRLATHRDGQGSRITRELHSRGIPWSIGHIAETTQTEMRRIERKLKDTHHIARYCAICHGNDAKRMPGTRPMDPGLLPPLPRQETPDIVFRITTEMDINPIFEQRIKRLMSADKDALGFIPIGGPQGLATLIPRGRVIVAETPNDLIGYAVYTATTDGRQIKIQQVCVADSHRLHGIGKDLVSSILNENECAQASCKVRNDLAANEFWTAIGFEENGSEIHKTSGNVLNRYTLQPYTVKNSL